MMRSADEWLMSRSPHKATFSIAVSAWPLISRASPQMRSESSGLRLCGMDEEPVCPGPKGSSSSWISVRCNERISVANFSSEAAMRARVVTRWAWRSRCTIWLETPATASPNWRHTRSSTDGGMVAWVPTAPDSIPTRTPASAAVSRSRCRRSSSHHKASFSPSVIGSAWTPWVRPIISVSRCCRAWRSSASSAWSSSASSNSPASPSCRFRPVSSISLEVRPRCSQRPSGPKVAVMEPRKAVTSWRVVSNSASIRPAS